MVNCSFNGASAIGTIFCPAKALGEKKSPLDFQKLAKIRE